METLLALALSWALRYTDYPEPAELPRVEFKTDQWMREEYCPGIRNCRPWALYGDKGVIYLNERIGKTPQEWEHNTMAFAILAHEMTHYLQDLDGQTLACEEITPREREGYYVQQEIIVFYGIYAPTGVFPQLPCED